MRLGKHMDMIIVEGPDGAGKTTLLNQLVRIFHMIRIKLGGPPVDEVEGLDRLQKMTNNIDSSSTPWIFDRLPMISEQVYGPILRGHTRPKSIRLIKTALAQFIRCHDPLVIICQSPTGTAKTMVDEEKSWKPESLKEQVRANFPAILEGYFRIAWDLNHVLDDGRLILYNYATSNPWDLVNLVGRYVHSKRPECWYPGYGG